MSYGDGTSLTGQWRRRREKQRRRTVKNGDGEGLIAWLRSKRKPRSSLLHASTKPKMATNAPGNQKKVAGGEVSAAGTVQRNYRIATRIESKITPKFMWQLKNLQK